MIKFKDFINEELKFFIKNNGYTVYDTHHSLERKVQRADNIVLRDEFKKIFMRIIKKINSNFDYLASASHYLFYSKEYQQGIVVEFVPDKKILKIITVFEKGHKKPKDGTKLKYVESIINEHQIISEDNDALQYIVNLIPENIINSVDPKYDFEKVKLGDYLELYFSNGKLYDLNAEVIVID